MKRKKAMTLIEVLVSLGLFSLLLSSLLFFFHLFSKNKIASQKIKWQVCDERYALSRLESIISHATLPFFKSEKNGGLIFYFERGIFEEPLLSGTVLGHLFWDKENHTICLGVWPKPQKDNLLTTPSQTFILMENVKSLEIDFYSPALADAKVVNPEKIDPSIPHKEWQGAWPSEFNRLPALVRMKITRGETQILAIIDLHQPIYYPRDQIKT